MLVPLGVLLFRWALTQKPADDAAVPTYTLCPRDLTLEVTESGNIKALNPVEIKSQVEGRTTIVKVVPEGTIITPADVAAGKVLVELDTSDLKERLNRKEIDFYNAEASFTEAEKAYEIQIKQNESDIKAAELKVKFGCMDFEKYLGEKVVAQLLDPNNHAARASFDVGDLLDHPESLGGESLQRWRDLNSKIDIAREEYKQAQSNFEWTRKLYEKEYVTRTEYEADQLKVKQKKIQVDQSLMSLDLFQRYELPKQAEKLYSDYLEALRSLDRTRKQAAAKLAQSKAQVKSTESRFHLQRERLTKLRNQLNACIVKAPCPGLVVYSKSGFRSNRQIEVGAEIRERQKIMSLLNAAEMAVEVKVHEIWMAKVKPGQSATITVDAFPDKVFSGKVIKVSQLPDQQNWFMNPDLKVYSTEVSIHGAEASLKAGMSAKVTIRIKQLKNVLAVPIQAVVTRGGVKLCYAKTPNGPKACPVQTGAFNENFIQIIKGLSPGQEILLVPPRRDRLATPSPKKSSQPKSAPKPDSKPQTSARKAA